MSGDDKRICPEFHRLQSIQEELEVLESIYLDDLQVDYEKSGYPCVISICLHPSTGDSVEQKYVCLTLVMELSSHYPDEAPRLMIKNPRGLADEEVARTFQKLQELANERQGCPVLYELIELAKESLTEGNIPHGQCVICLECFHEGEEFTRTDCYHYFHCHCLYRHLEHAMMLVKQEKEEQARLGAIHLQQPNTEFVCPVCRSPIPCDIDPLRQAVPPTTGSEQFLLTDELKKMQDKMTQLFLKQKARGGIIDLEEEKNKYLISASSSSPNLVAMDSSGQSTHTASTDTDCDKGQVDAEKPSESRNANEKMKKGHKPSRGHNRYSHNGQRYGRGRGRPHSGHGGFNSGHRPDQRSAQRSPKEHQKRGHVKNESPNSDHSSGSLKGVKNEIVHDKGNVKDCENEPKVTNGDTGSTEVKMSDISLDNSDKTLDLPINNQKSKNYKEHHSDESDKTRHESDSVHGYPRGGSSGRRHYRGHEYIGHTGRGQGWGHHRKNDGQRYKGNQDDKPTCNSADEKVFDKGCGSEKTLTSSHRSMQEGRGRGNLKNNQAIDRLRNSEKREHAMNIKLQNEPKTKTDSKTEHKNELTEDDIHTRFHASKTKSAVGKTARLPPGFTPEALLPDGEPKNNGTNLSLSNIKGNPKPKRPPPGFKALANNLLENENKGFVESDDMQ